MKVINYKRKYEISPSPLVVPADREIWWEILRLFIAPRTARRLPEVVRYIVALAHAARRELEPVRENASAVVGRIVGQQTMQSVLLFASAAVSTVHLFVFVSANKSVVSVGHRFALIVDIESNWNLLTSIVPSERIVRRGTSWAVLKSRPWCCWPRMEPQLLLSPGMRFCKHKILKIKIFRNYDFFLIVKSTKHFLRGQFFWTDGKSTPNPQDRRRLIRK